MPSGRSTTACCTGARSPRPRPTARSLIDRRTAAAVARRFAGDGSLRASPLIVELQQDLSQAVPRAESLVAEASGLQAPSATWAVIDRGRWAEANIAGMVAMLQPLAEKVAARMSSTPWPVRVAQRTLVSVELGVLLGYVSRRVLGQYDLLVPDSESRRGRRAPPSLYFIGPNMIDTQLRLRFVPDEFALWVAVHEMTHRFQFEGVPWLRDRFFGLVHSYLESVDVDGGALARRLAQGARRAASRETPPEERNPVYLLATDEQKELLNDIQALMAVVEGHGNFVMDDVGERVIPSFHRMRHLFNRRRRQANIVQRIFNNVIGLEMKMRQYELGQSFCNEIVAREGREVLTHLWSTPASLPTLDELRVPGRWLTRVA